LLQRTKAHLCRLSVCCSVLPCVAVCCNAQRYTFVGSQCVAVCLLQRTEAHLCRLQCVAACCNTQRHTFVGSRAIKSHHQDSHCNTLHHTATHYTTLQHTATHCNTLQHTATHCNTLQQPVPEKMRLEMVFGMRTRTTDANENDSF